jgi:uncharacterized membrane protein
VGTFLYAILVLISIGGSGAHFVPDLSISTAVALVAISMAVLIFFIHHIAVSIQLPRVIPTIAQDLANVIDAESRTVGAPVEAGPPIDQMLRRLSQEGGAVGAPASGCLQFIQHHTLWMRPRASPTPCDAPASPARTGRSPRIFRLRWISSRRSRSEPCRRQSMTLSRR